MGKWAHEDVYKNGLQEVKDNATRMTACSQQPTTREEAVSAYELSDVDVSSSDFSWAEGSSGWNLTVAAKADQTVDSDGEVSHIAFVDNSRLLLVTTTRALQVYVGGLFSFPSFTMKQIL
jgi:hypothetical protein